MAGIGAASFCGVYGAKDTADSPVAAAWLLVAHLQGDLYWLIAINLNEKCGGQPPKKTKKPEKFWLKASFPDFILLC